MFLSKLDELEAYDSYVGHVVSAFMDTHDVHTMETGRYDLAEDGYVKVEEYDTGINMRYEAHQKYVDVQVIMKGEEDVWYAKLHQGTELVPYDEATDATFYTCEKGHRQVIHFTEHHALVLMPDDLHAPANFESVKHVRKLIFKIPVQKVQNPLFYR